MLILVPGVAIISLRLAGKLNADRILNPVAKNFILQHNQKMHTMMYRSFFSFACLLFFGVCQAQPVNFSIKGRLSNKSTAQKVLLQHTGIHWTEVALTDKQTFYYKGSLPNPGVLIIKTDSSYVLNIWVAEGNIDVEVEEYYNESINNTGKKTLKIKSISGPPETEKYEWFRSEHDALTSRFFSSDKEHYKDSVAKYFYPLLENYIKVHPDSKFSAFMIRFAATDEQKTRLLALLKGKIIEEDAATIERRIRTRNLLKPGDYIADFEMNTINRGAFSLNKITSKYTLLEFWASWCAPCRKENPLLVKAYNQFHNKGFEIVAISLDEWRGAWKKAIDQDGLPWIHVSELKGWDDPLVRKYQISAIPMNILIDEHKKIVATNLRGDALAKTLAKLLPD